MAADVLDDPALCRHLFFPRRTRVQAPFLVEGEGFRLGPRPWRIASRRAQPRPVYPATACRYRRVDPARPTVIHFHGNGETVAELLEAASPLKRSRHLCQAPAGHAPLPPPGPRRRAGDAGGLAGLAPGRA